jgi:hypothetical protein
VLKRFVPAKLHGYLDFLTVGVIITGGDLFRVKDAPGSIKPAQVAGPAIAVYSLLTDYGSDNSFGSGRLLSMRTHVLLDAAVAIPVGLSPWLTGSWRKGWNYWAPQMLLATSELFFALTTKLETE